MDTPQQQAGFTIIEIIITLMVVAILLAIAGPAFRDFIVNSQLTTATNNLIASISYARSEAVRQAQTVRILADDDGWAGGWTIVDQGGNTLRTFDPLPANIQMDGAGGELQFDGRGLLLGQAAGATISICDSRPDIIGRQIDISATGRPRLDRQHDCGN